MWIILIGRLAIEEFTAILCELDGKLRLLRWRFFGGSGVREIPWVSFDFFLPIAVLVLRIGESGIKRSFLGRYPDKAE